jgi:hypothetical protein
MEPLVAAGREGRHKGDKLARKLAIADRAFANVQQWAASSVVSGQ